MKGAGGGGLDRTRVAGVSHADTLEDMPDVSSGGTPPEVPEEFAEAYLAAYRAALEAQSVPAQEPSEPRTRRHAGGPTSWRPHRHVEEPADDTAPPPVEPEAEVAEAADAWDDLPERTRPIRLGTHRQPDEERDPTAYERLRDSGWLVPVLLLLLGLLLVLGAYVLGRAFATHVATKGSGSAQSHVSSRSVTGPSLTRDTAMSAPKTPVSTCVPACSSAARTAS